MNHNAEDEAIQEGAELVVMWGRWWLMPDHRDEVPHAAKCIIRDPVYRSELAREARNRLKEIKDFDTLGKVESALARMDGTHVYEHCDGSPVRYVWVVQYEDGEIYGVYITPEAAANGAGEEGNAAEFERFEVRNG